MRSVFNRPCDDLIDIVSNYYHPNIKEYMCHCGCAIRYKGLELKPNVDFDVKDVFCIKYCENCGDTYTLIHTNYDEINSYLREHGENINDI